MMKRNAALLTLVLSSVLAACGTIPTADGTPPTQDKVTIPQVPDAAIILDQTSSITLFSLPNPERPGFSDQQLYWKDIDGQVRRSSVADGQNVRVMSAVMQPGTQRAFVMLWKTVNGFAQDSIVELDLGTDQVVRLVADLTGQGVIEAFDNTLRLSDNQLQFRARPVFRDRYAEIQTVTVSLDGKLGVLEGQQELVYQGFIESKLDTKSQLNPQTNLSAQAVVMQLYWPKSNEGHHFPGSGAHTGVDANSLDINRGGGDTDLYDPVRSAATGQAKVYSWDGVTQGYGRQVLITHPSGAKTRYAHLYSVAISDAVSVAAKQSLGKVGKTGLPSGSAYTAHLHFTLYSPTGSGEVIANSSYPMYVKVGATGSCVNATTDLRTGADYFPC